MIEKTKLEWRKTEDGSFAGFAGGKQRRFIRLGWMIDEPYEFGFKSFPTAEEAQAAAQADFDAEVAEILALAKP